MVGGSSPLGGLLAQLVSAVLLRFYILEKHVSLDANECSSEVAPSHRHGEYFFSVAFKKRNKMKSKKFIKNTNYKNTFGKYFSNIFALFNLYMSVYLFTFFNEMWINNQPTLFFLYVAVSMIFIIGLPYIISSMIYELMKTNQKRVRDNLIKNSLKEVRIKNDYSEINYLLELKTCNYLYEIFFNMSSHMNAYDYTKFSVIKSIDNNNIINESVKWFYDMKIKRNMNQENFNDDEFVMEYLENFYKNRLQVFYTGVNEVIENRKISKFDLVMTRIDKALRPFYIFK